MPYFTVVKITKAENESMYTDISHWQHTFTKVLTSMKISPNQLVRMVWEKSQ